MRLDIHNYPLRLQRTLQNLKESPGITPQNREIIMRFYDECCIQGLTKARLIRLIDTMICLARVIPVPFDTATVDDIKRLVRVMDEKELTAWTKSTHKAILKKFYKWLKGNNEDFPPEVKWVKATIKRKDLPLLSSQELLTESDVSKALDACDHPRNKAFLAVLFESGCRVGEIGTLAIKNVLFDKHGAVLTVNGKTGSRRIRILKNAPFLANWLNNHPFRENQDAAVWINVGATNNRQPMKYNALAKIISDAFKKAGLQKRCNPHLFRHSRASIMASHLTEFQMNHYFGWIQGSDMASTYVHLSGKDLDGAILKLNGIEQPQETMSESKPRICTRCDTINTINSTYCNKCAGILDEKLILQEQKHYLQEQQATKNANDLMNRLMQDEDVQKFLAERVLALGLRNSVVNV